MPRIQGKSIAEPDKRNLENGGSLVNVCEMLLEEFALSQQQILFREPCEEDGPRIWSLVKSTNILDLNSVYSYLMLCKYFPDTCIVVEHHNEIAGFLSAFRPPANGDVIFVWQVAVTSSKRGMGLGTALLKELLRREACRGIHFLETTVTPSNIPSQSLFHGLARRLGAQLKVTECFSADLFPGGNHETEFLFRIGPF
jgi:L-2,4-diaminobutyric acid acetyltransferase